MKETPPRTDVPHGHSPQREDAAARMQREADAAAASARSAIDDVRHEATATMDHARHQAEAVAEEQRTAISSLMRDIGVALNTAAGELGQRQQTAAAEYAGAIGSGIERISDSIERKSAQEMMSDLTHLARAHPAAYLGGAMLLGVALARFAVASSPKAADQSLTDRLERERSATHPSTYMSSGEHGPVTENPL